MRKIDNPEPEKVFNDPNDKPVIIKDPRTGQFLPGNGARNAGRPKGSKNKIDTDVRKETIAGLARHGSDGNGKDGFQGYVYYLACEHPEAAATLVAKLLPKEVKADVGLGGGVRVGFTINAVPSGQYVTEEQMRELYPQLRAPVIEHEDETVHELSLEELEEHQRKVTRLQPYYMKD